MGAAGTSSHVSDVTFVTAERKRASLTELQDHQRSSLLGTVGAATPLLETLAAARDSPLGVGMLRRILLVWTVRQVQDFAIFADALFTIHQLNMDDMFAIHLYVRFVRG